MTTEGLTEVAATSRWVALAARDHPWNILAHEGGLLGAGTGGTVDHAMTAAEALEATGLTMTVKKYPVSIDTSREHNGDKMVRMPKLFVTGYETEDDDLQTFGPVSDKYEIVQPAEALAMLDEVVKAQNGAYYTAAWNMPEKARMGVVMHLPRQIVLDPGGRDDTIDCNLLGENSFDGSTALGGTPIASRIFCTNQLPYLRALGREQAFRFRHTKNVNSRANDARRILAATFKYLDALEAVGTKLIQKDMTDRQFEKFLEQCTPFQLKDDMGDLTKERIKERRLEALNAWNADYNENIHGTAWGAFQVVVEYAQWGRTVVGSNRNNTSIERQRAIGTMVHPDPAAWGRQAFDLLTK